MNGNDAITGNIQQTAAQKCDCDFRVDDRTLDDDKQRSVSEYYASSQRRSKSPAPQERIRRQSRAHLYKGGATHDYNKLYEDNYNESDDSGFESDDEHSYSDETHAYDNTKATDLPRPSTPSFRDMHEHENLEMKKGDSVGDLSNHLIAHSYANSALHKIVGDMNVDHSITKYAIQVMSDALHEIENIATESMFVDRVEYSKSNKFLIHKAEETDENNRQTEIIRIALSNILPNHTMLYCLQGEDIKGNRITVAIAQPDSELDILPNGENCACTMPMLSDAYCLKCTEDFGEYDCSVCEKIMSHPDSKKALVVFESAHDENNVVYAIADINRTKVASNIRVYKATTCTTHNVPEFTLLEAGKSVDYSYLLRYESIIRGYVNILLRQIPQAELHYAEGRRILEIIDTFAHKK